MKKIDYFGYYNFFSSYFVQIVRFAILLGVPVILFYTFDLFFIFRITLLIYALFLINELFIHFEVNSSMPVLKSADEGDPEKSLLFPVRKILLSKNINFSQIRKIANINDADFLIDKIGGYIFSDISVDRNELLNRAREVGLRLNANYICTSDILVAFILMTELQTHFLAQKELTENDLFEVLSWTREKFHPDIKKKFRIHFMGSGVFDFFIYGWNTQLREYAFDLTYSAVGENATPIVGREEEFSQMVGVLTKKTKNNVLIIGDPGTGRSALVKRLALESYRDTSFILKNVEVYEVLVDRLLAGVENSGQLEERLELLLAEASHTGNTILFIQNIENIFGGGGFGFDMSGILFEYLKNGAIQIIGTTTPSSYKTIIQKKESISGQFEAIRLEEPSREVLIKMLSSHVDNIEKEFGVSITYKAVHEVIELSSSYLPDEFLPGKAINLLQDVSSRIRLEGKKIVDKDDVVKVIEQKTNIVLERPNVDEKKVLLSLEDSLHKRVVGQNEAISAVAKAVRRLRSGFSHGNRPVSVFLFLGPTGVGKTETAKALASVYFGDDERMIRLDMSEFQDQAESEKILGALPGNDFLENSLTEEVRLHPFSLILLDEFEKAHPTILNVFLQVFEDGRLTDNQGKTVSFKNAIIIATSNAGSEAIREMITAGKNPQDYKNEIVEGMLRSEMFKPELMNRFDDVIIFKSLTVEEAKQVAGLILNDSLKSLEDDQIFVQYSDEALTKIVKESYDEEAGARNMRRYIGSTIEDFISKLILEDKLQKGSHVTLSVDRDGEFVLK